MSSPPSQSQSPTSTSQGSQSQSQSSQSDKNTSSSSNTSSSCPSSTTHNSSSGSSSQPTSNSTSTNSHSTSTNHSMTSFSSGMDTCPVTQELIDTVPIGSDEEEETSSAWGRLFPVKSPPFNKLYLIDDNYSFGRGDDCDVSMATYLHQLTYFFKAYSKVHFKIERRETSTGVHVFLEDCSSNGTFINNSKVGKGNSQVLMQFDEIALAHTKNKAYIYQNLTEKEEDGLPKELTDNYLLTKELGKGAYGEVRLAFEKGQSNPGKVAVKIISNRKLTVGGRNLQDGTSDIMREVEIMKAVSHPCIVKVLKVIEAETKTFILLELVEGGELFDRVLKVGCFPEPVSKLLFYQMLLAVEHLHKNNITHRDLKPENILLADPDSDECLIKVTDFGVSKLVNASTMMQTMVGTPNYLAPEVLQSRALGEYDSKVDCWSLGVILFICLCGYPPFTSDRTDLSLPEQIKTGNVKFEKEYWKDISKPAVELVKKLLTVDPKKRPTIGEVLEHPWLKDDEEMKGKAEKLMWPGGRFTAPLAVKKRPREGTDSSSSSSAPPPAKAPHTSSEKPASPKKSPEKNTKPGSKKQVEDK